MQAAFVNIVEGRKQALVLEKTVLESLFYALEVRPFGGSSQKWIFFKKAIEDTL